MDGSVIHLLHNFSYTRFLFVMRREVRARLFKNKSGIFNPEVPDKTFQFVRE